MSGSESLKLPQTGGAAFNSSAQIITEAGERTESNGKMLIGQLELRSALQREFRMSLQHFSNDWSARQEAILNRFCMSEEVTPVDTFSAIANRGLDDVSVSESRKSSSKSWLHGAISSKTSQRSVGEEAPRHRKLLSALLKSESYVWIHAIIVLVDMFVALWDGELASQSISEASSTKVMDFKESLITVILTNVLCAYFFFDLVIRFYSKQSSFFAKKLRWKIIEVFSVMSFTIAIVAQHSNLDHTSRFLSVIHQIALCRLLRFADVVLHSKLTFTYCGTILQDLRLLFNATFASLSTLLTAVVVILYLCLVFGLVFADAYVNLFKEQGTVDEEQLLQLKRHFGSPAESILSLYKSMTGAYDWEELYVIVQYLGSVYQVIYLIFQFLAYIVLINAIAAVFVDRMLERSKHDRRYMAESVARANENFRERMKQIFTKLDSKHKGMIDIEDLREGFRNRRLGAYFHSMMRIDSDQADHFFQLLDTEGSGALNMDAFVRGCARMKGEAKNFDLALMQRSIRTMDHDMREGFKVLMNIAAQRKATVLL